MGGIHGKDSVINTAINADIYVQSGEFPMLGFPDSVGVVTVTVLASSSHFCSRGLSLHMFLKLRFSASNREIVVWEKSLP